MNRTQEATLTSEQRKKLPKSAYAIPEKKAYPIHDANHARNALARVAQHGSEEEKARVRAAVKRRYPHIGKTEEAATKKCAACNYDVPATAKVCPHCGAKLVEEAVLGRGGSEFDPKLHPRGRGGRFIETLSKLRVGQKMEVPGGATITRTKGGYRYGPGGETERALGGPTLNIEDVAFHAVRYAEGLDIDPDVASEEVRKRKGGGDYSPEVKQGLADWRANKAYLDNSGNYRLKGETSKKGPIAPWNKAVKAAFPDNEAFHRAATPEKDRSAYDAEVAKQKAKESEPLVKKKGAPPEPKPGTPEFKAAQKRTSKRNVARYGKASAFERGPVTVKTGGDVMRDNQKLGSVQGIGGPGGTKYNAHGRDDKLIGKYDSKEEAAAAVARAADTSNRKKPPRPGTPEFEGLGTEGLGRVTVGDRVQIADSDSPHIGQVGIMTRRIGGEALIRLRSGTKVRVPRSALRLAHAAMEVEEVKSKVYPGLERSPKKNWVEQVGGLPSYIERVAKHLHYEKGRSISVAIATAINHAKKMCASGTAFGGKVKVSPKAQATACKAVAQWEAKKARSKGKGVAEAGAAPEPMPRALIQEIGRIQRHATLTADDARSIAQSACLPALDRGGPARCSAPRRQDGQALRDGGRLHAPARRRRTGEP